MYKRQELLKSGRSEYAKAVIDNKKTQTTQKQTIKQMQAQIDSLTNEEITLLAIKEEVKVLFPALASYSVSKDISNVNLEDTAINNTPVLMINWREKSGLTPSQKEKETEKIIAYIRLRLNLKELKLMEVK